jgi:hypothetical protein
MIISHMVLMKSLIHNYFHHKMSMTKEKYMETSKCHLYDYKMTIVFNDVGGWKPTPSNVIVVAYFWKQNWLNQLGVFVYYYLDLYIKIKVGALCLNILQAHNLFNQNQWWDQGHVN